ncbi:MAG: hypothetical protein ACJA2S_004858, partial [Cyclobacteriaceae bacterium]
DFKDWSSKTSKIHQKQCFSNIICTKKSSY